MQMAHGGNESVNRKLEALYTKSGIETRYSCLNDFSLDNPDSFYPDYTTSVEQRLNEYADHALSLSLESIERCLLDFDKQLLTHLITVSCTGMSAPGLDLQLVDHLSLPNSISRSSVNFMGCYAAIHALKIANDICLAHTNAQVLIVCTELCTLHFQKEPTDDNLLANCLFSDGSAALLISNAKKGFEIKGFYSEIHAKGKDEMSWKIGSNGFLMGLTGLVPKVIKEAIKEFKNKSWEILDWVDAQDVRYAVHPGGKKIIEAIAIELELSYVKQSYDVLKKYGNMSSASILFVLHAIQETMPKELTKVWGVAFGPGLVMESFGLEYVG